MLGTVVGGDTTLAMPVTVLVSILVTICTGRVWRFVQGVCESEGGVRGMGWKVRDRLTKGD